MKRVNFKAFTIYKNVTRTKSIVADIREQMSEAVYNACTGVTAVALALKIHQSEGVVEITEKEEEMLRNMAEGLLSGAIGDSIKAALDENNLD